MTAICALVKQSQTPVKAFVREHPDGSRAVALGPLRPKARASLAGDRASRPSAVSVGACFHVLALTMISMATGDIDSSRCRNQHIAHRFPERPRRCGASPGRDVFPQPERRRHRHIASSGILYRSDVHAYRCDPPFGNIDAIIGRRQCSSWQAVQRAPEKVLLCPRRPADVRESVDYRVSDMLDLRTHPRSAGPASDEQMAEQWLTS